MINQQIYDVAIVGYGPVGVTAANFLGMYGIKTAVFERETSAYHLPRAIGLNHEIIRIFQQLAWHEQILSVVTPIKGVQFLNSAHEILFEIKLRETCLSAGFEPNYVFYQPDLEAKLREGASRFDCVAVYLGHAVESITQDQDGVNIVGCDFTQNQEFKVRAKYVLGCDGARSLIRQLTNIKLDDFAFDKRQLVVDTFLKEKLELPPVVQQLCDTSRSGVFVHSTKTHRRWEFVLFDGETKAEMECPQKVRELISQYWLDPDKVEVIRAVVYNFHSVVAQQWRKQRIFLVGDAAHQMPPILGQGMCSGIRDAQNLCWKLDLVLRGLGSDQLLDSYQEERLPHVREIIKLATRMFTIFKTANPFVAFVRDLILRMLRWLGAEKRFQNLGSDMPSLKYGILGNSVGGKQPMAGQMFIQPLVHTCTGKQVLLDEVLGNGFAVLGFETDLTGEIDPDLLSFFKSLPTNFVNVLSLGTKVQLLTDTTEIQQIEDVSGQIGDWFTQHKGKLVIVRPDRYVFGVYERNQINLALSSLRSLLTGKPIT